MPAIKVKYVVVSEKELNNIIADLVRIRDNTTEDFAQENIAVCLQDIQKIQSRLN